MMKFKSKYLYLIIFIVILSVVPYILISCGGGSYNSDQEIHDQKASYITFAIVWNDPDDADSPIT